MSLDYIFVKAIAFTDSIDELQEDESFRLDDYKALGSRLFPGIAWDRDHSARLSTQVSVLEVEASDVSLTVRIRGQSAEPEVVLNLATLCRGENVVVVDAQTSELVTAESAAQSAEEYKAWYRAVLESHK